MSKPFARLSRDSQIDHMRAAARRVLHDYDLADAKLRLLNHDFNTTFRIDTADGRRYAMRIALNSRRPIETVRAEVDWVGALAADSDVAVATPIPTSEGEPVTTAHCGGIERELPTVVYSWLDGRALGAKATTSQLRALGRATAHLHRHGERWRSATTADLPDVTGIMMDSPDNLRSVDLPFFDDGVKAVIDEARRHVSRLTAPLFVGDRHVVHADLHPWNAKWHKGRLSVLDFDDCGIGVPIHDLAISCYYVHDSVAKRTSILEGYASVRELPEHTPEQFEALVASRNLILLNDVLDMVTADYDEFVPEYVELSKNRLQAYLDTGTFRLDIDDG